MILRSHRGNLKTCFFIVAAIFLLIAGAALPASAQAAKPAAKSVAPSISPAILSQLKYRFIGPFPGNRSAAVCGVPGDMLTYYVGASSGGIFKSIDGGYSWQPIFDDQPVQSIGSLAVAFSDPNVVWAGTGEAWVRSSVSIGDGVYKSTDAGKTWHHMGLEKSGRIGRVAIDPRNPDVVFVASMGHCYGPQKERGVYRTKDGGKTWEQVLFIDENTGVMDIAMDFNNPRILFAGSWPLLIRTWHRESGGPNGGLWKSTDGGDTWTRLTGHGLPEPPIGKVGVAIAQSNSNVVYAMMETGGQPNGPPNRGVLWRSNDGGENWQLQSYNRLLNERTAYNGRLAVNPADEDEVYFAANSMSRTLDGGYDVNTVPWGGDNHDVWVDPSNPNRIMVSNDGGGIISENRGKSWMRIQLPIAQMMKAFADTAIPYNVYGGMQDGGGGGANAYGGWKVPSIPITVKAGSQVGTWTAGGECGWVVPDPVDPNIVWGGSYGANLQRIDSRNGHVVSAKVWPESTYGNMGTAFKYRFQWTFPIAISPHDHNVVYVGSQFVHRTTDAGRSWEVISPDLTLNDPSMLGPSGGLTYDNLAVELGCAVFSIAESPVEKGCIWAGTNDGQLQITRDAGKTWTNVIKAIPNLPPLGSFTNVEPSRYDAGTCYVSVDLHQVNNRDPFIYKTTDYGKTWTYLGGDIPKSVFSYVHWIDEDPVRKGLLYTGTENSIYVSFNDGKNWVPLVNNLPHTPVYGITIQEHFNDLVVATYGRGFYIMDDITPLQQLTDDVLNSDSFLFKPRPAYRLNPVLGGHQGSSAAHINYYLKNVPAGPVTITVTDEQGREAAVLNGTRQVGINRVTWNMGYPGIRTIKFRTKPPGNPHVVEEKRYHFTWEREGWYPWNIWGSAGGLNGFRAAPGMYTVKMNVDGKESTQKLEILKDPHSIGTVDDMKAQAELQFQVRDGGNAAADMLNQLEWMRRQIDGVKNVIAGKNLRTVEAAIAEYDKKLWDEECELTQSSAGEGDNKSFRDPAKLYEKWSVLAVDIIDSADCAPNKQQIEVAAMLKQQLDVQKANFARLTTADLAAFNKVLADNGVAGISVPVVSERGGPIPDED